MLWCKSKPWISTFSSDLSPGIICRHLHYPALFQKAASPVSALRAAVSPFLPAKGKLSLWTQKSWVLQTSCSWKCYFLHLPKRDWPQYAALREAFDSYSMLTSLFHHNQGISLYVPWHCWKEQPVRPMHKGLPVKFSKSWAPGNHQLLKCHILHFIYVWFGKFAPRNRPTSTFSPKPMVFLQESQRCTLSIALELQNTVLFALLLKGVGVMGCSRFHTENSASLLLFWALICQNLTDWQMGEGETGN